MQSACRHQLYICTSSSASYARLASACLAGTSQSKSPRGRFFQQEDMAEPVISAQRSFALRCHMLERCIHTKRTASFATGPACPLLCGAAGNAAHVSGTGAMWTESATRMPNSGTPQSCQRHSRMRPSLHLSSHLSVPLLRTARAQAVPLYNTTAAPQGKCFVDTRQSAQL